jgi:hypothetical protein
MLEEVVVAVILATRLAAQAAQVLVVEVVTT